jgi:hypothetical protein
MSIRERIKAIERQLLPGDVPPSTARHALMTLTALLGPVLDEVREAEREYRHVLSNRMQQVKTKSAAEIQAQTSDEYQRYRVADDAKDLVEQMIITCRGYLRSVDEEVRLAR